MRALRAVGTLERHRWRIFADRRLPRGAVSAGFSCGAQGNKRTLCPDASRKFPASRAKRRRRGACNCARPSAFTVNSKHVSFRYLDIPHPKIFPSLVRREQSCVLTSKRDEIHFQVPRGGRCYTLRPSRRLRRKKHKIFNDIGNDVRQWCDSAPGWRGLGESHVAGSA